MWNQALKFNSDADESFNTSDLNFYNTCGTGKTDIDTNWTTIFSFNCVLYALMSLFTMAVCVGTYWLPLVILGGIGQCLGLVA